MIRRLHTRLIGIGLTFALVVAACGSSGGGSSKPSADTVPIRQPTQAEFDAAGVGDLKVAPAGDRIDTAMPPFSNPTDINPLFPISDTMEWVRDRFAGSLDRVDVIPIDAHLMELRNTVNDADPAAAIAEAEALRDTLAGIAPAS
jgi:hypothetical protein